MAELGLFFDGIVERLRSAYVLAVVFSIRLIRARIGTPYARTLARHKETYLNHLICLTF
jgi:hypothetical protein